MSTKTMMVNATILSTRTVMGSVIIVPVLFVEVTGDVKVVVLDLSIRIPMVFATDSRRDSLPRAAEASGTDAVAEADTVAAGDISKVAAVMAVGAFPVKVPDLAIAIPMVFVIDSRRGSLLRAAEASDTDVGAGAEEQGHSNFVKEPGTNSLNDAEKKSRRFPVTGKPAFFVLVAWLVLGWVCLVAWQAFEHAASVQVHKDNLVRLGKANIRVLEAAIRSMGRGRRERPDFLSYVLDEIVAVPEIKGVWLKELDGTLLASTVSSEGFSPPSTESEETWLEDGLVVGQNIDVSGCPIGGSGRTSNLANERRIVRMSLFLDRVHLDREIESDTSLRTAIVAVAAVVFAGVFLLLRSQKKSKVLRAELGLAEERVRRNKEWALLGAGLAHETKNPISVIRGMAQQLTEEDSASSCEYRKYAGRIVDEVDRIVTRIDEFLQFSRPVEPNLAPVNVLELFQEMASLIKVDLSPREGRVKIESDPLVTIRADENMLRQILLNLLVNSAYSLSYGGEIELHAGLSDDDSVSVEVKDNGEGIAAEEIDKVFEPYYTRTEGGTGLGLAIVRRLVEAHGWHITISSELGAGTSVMISGMEQVK